MYIPELDALIFLATEFLEGDADQPTLESGIRALHEAAGKLSKSVSKAPLPAVKPASSSYDLLIGTTYTPSQTPRRSKVSDRLARRGCIDLLEQLGVPLQVQTTLLSLLTIAAQHLMGICCSSTDFVKRVFMLHTPADVSTLLFKPQKVVCRMISCQ